MQAPQPPPPPSPHPPPPRDAFGRLFAAAKAKKEPAKKPRAKKPKPLPRGQVTIAEGFERARQLQAGEDDDVVEIVGDKRGREDDGEDQGENAQIDPVGLEDVDAVLPEDGNLTGGEDSFRENDEGGGQVDDAGNTQNGGDDVFDEAEYEDFLHSQRPRRSRWMRRLHDDSDVEDDPLMDFNNNLREDEPEEAQMNLAEDEDEIGVEEKREDVIVPQDEGHSSLPQNPYPNTQNEDDAVPPNNPDGVEGQGERNLTPTPGVLQYCSLFQHRQVEDFTVVSSRLFFPSRPPPPLPKLKINLIADEPLTMAPSTLEPEPGHAVPPSFTREVVNDGEEAGPSRATDFPFLRPRRPSALRNYAIEDDDGDMGDDLDEDDDDYENMDEEPDFDMDCEENDGNEEELLVEEEMRPEGDLLNDAVDRIFDEEEGVEEDLEDAEADESELLPPPQQAPGNNEGSGYDGNVAPNGDNGDLPAQPPIDGGIDALQTNYHRKGALTFSIGNGVYRCKKCPEVTGNYEQLRYHTQLVHWREKKIYRKCECGFEGHGNQFRRHTAICKNNGIKFSCAKCFDVFKTQKSLSIHATKKHDSKVLPCKKCGKCIPTHFMTNHLLKCELTNDTTTKCEVCSSILSVKGGNDQNINFEHYNEFHPNFCFECKENLPTRTEKMQHDVDIHHIASNLDDYACSICGMLKKNKAFVLTHKVIRHGFEYPDGKPKCPICRKECSRTETLGWHARVHNLKSGLPMSSPWKCGKCNEYFKDMPSLHFHQRFCRDEDSFFKCHECGEVFLDNKALKSHIKTVHKGIPDTYYCDVCPTTTTSMAAINEHIKESHKKTVSCTNCPRTFHAEEALQCHRYFCNNGNKGTFPCREKDCHSCGYVRSRSNAVLNGVEYEAAGRYNCQSRNVIYVMTCTFPGCNQFYVGRTSTSLDQRFHRHMGDIFQKLGKKGVHFMEHGLDYLNIEVIGHIPTGNNSKARIEDLLSKLESKIIQETRATDFLNVVRGKIFS